MSASEERTHIDDETAIQQVLSVLELEPLLKDYASGAKEEALINSLNKAIIDAIDSTNDHEENQKALLYFKDTFNIEPLSGNNNVNLKVSHKVRRKEKEEKKAYVFSFTGLVGAGGLVRTDEKAEASSEMINQQTREKLEYDKVLGDSLFQYTSTRETNTPSHGCRFLLKPCHELTFQSHIAKRREKHQGLYTVPSQQISETTQQLSENKSRQLQFIELCQDCISDLSLLNETFRKMNKHDVVMTDAKAGNFFYEGDGLIVEDDKSFLSIDMLNRKRQKGDNALQATDGFASEYYDSSTEDASFKTDWENVYRINNKSLASHAFLYFAKTIKPPKMKNEIKFPASMSTLYKKTALLQNPSKTQQESNQLSLAFSHFIERLGYVDNINPPIETQKELEFLSFLCRFAEKNLNHPNLEKMLATLNQHKEFILISIENMDDNKKIKLAENLCQAAETAVLSNPDNNDLVEILSECLTEKNDTSISSNELAFYSYLHDFSQTHSNNDKLEKVLSMLHNLKNDIVAPLEINDIEQGYAISAQCDYICNKALNFKLELYQDESKQYYQLKQNLQDDITILRNAFGDEISDTNALELHSLNDMNAIIQGVREQQSEESTTTDNNKEEHIEGAELENLEDYYADKQKDVFADFNPTAEMLAKQRAQRDLLKNALEEMKKKHNDKESDFSNSSTSSHGMK